jgi:lipopolysaccharide transport system permease protein
MIIKPSQRWAFPDLGELWEHRELLYFFAWRDIKVRYKQTMLGAAWAVIQPFFTMVVFTIFFGNLAKMPSEGLPYSIFSYTALVPWTYFANSVSQASSSMVAQRGVITKVYFPRLIVPLASMISGLLDFAIAFAVLVTMMLYYRIFPTINILLIPLLLLFSVATALAVGLWLSALNVVYRDVQYAVPFLVQFWLFATPIAYPSSLVPVRWRPLFGLNPMAGVVEGFRWSLLGSGEGLGPMFAVSVLIVLLLLITGLLYFRHMERVFADVV